MMDINYFLNRTFNLKEYKNQYKDVTFKISGKWIICTEQPFKNMIIITALTKEEGTFLDNLDNIEGVLQSYDVIKAYHEFVINKNDMDGFKNKLSDLRGVNQVGSVLEYLKKCNIKIPTIRIPQKGGYLMFKTYDNHEGYLITEISDIKEKKGKK